MPRLKLRIKPPVVGDGARRKTSLEVFFGRVALPRRHSEKQGCALPEYSASRKGVIKCRRSSRKRKSCKKLRNYVVEESTLEVSRRARMKFQAYEEEKAVSALLPSAVHNEAFIENAMMRQQLDCDDFAKNLDEGSMVELFCQDERVDYDFLFM